MGCQMDLVVDHWLSLISNSSTTFDDNQIDLSVFGQLRSWRSVGDNGQFPGVYRVDVLKQARPYRTRDR